ncbi:MAG: hypothetical protein ACI4LM_06965 [Anaerovoracaceae bacterium]
MKSGKRTGYIIQDAGMLLFLASVGLAVLVVTNAPAGHVTEFVIMMLLSFLCVIFAGFRLYSASIVMCGCLDAGYAMYVLYTFFYSDTEPTALSFAWLVLPVALAGSMGLFVYGSGRTEEENRMLLDQVNRLVTVNDVTGLFNLRSMYIELDRQAAYSRRNGVPLCLMIIKLRYEPELRKLLNTNEYNMMLQRMAVICEDALRLEDRIFSIDSRGSIGAVLSCPGEKCSFVKARLKDALEKKDAFDGIINGTIHVDVQIGYLEYDPEKYDNMMEFKAMAEKEVQYDV